MKKSVKQKLPSFLLGVTIGALILVVRHYDTLLYTDLMFILVLYFIIRLEIKINKAIKTLSDIVGEILDRT